jgi:hypothetical protein
MHPHKPSWKHGAAPASVGERDIEKNKEDVPKEQFLVPQEKDKKVDGEITNA